MKNNKVILAQSNLGLWRAYQGKYIIGTYDWIMDEPKFIKCYGQFTLCWDIYCRKSPSVKIVQKSAKHKNLQFLSSNYHDGFYYGAVINDFSKKVGHLKSLNDVKKYIDGYNKYKASSENNA